VPDIRAFFLFPIKKQTQRTWTNRLPNSRDPPWTPPCARYSQRCWRSIRGAVGDDDDFFELGGDSLLVIKLVARIRRTLSRELSPGDIFDPTTIASLARFLDNA